MRRRRRAQKRRQGCEASSRFPAMQAFLCTYRGSVVGTFKRIAASQPGCGPQWRLHRALLQVLLANQVDEQRCKLWEWRTRRERAFAMRASERHYAAAPCQGWCITMCFVIELKRHTQLSEAGGTASTACRQVGRHRRRTARLPSFAALVVGLIQTRTTTLHCSILRVQDET